MPDEIETSTPTPESRRSAIFDMLEDETPVVVEEQEEEQQQEEEVEVEVDVEEVEESTEEVVEEEEINYDEVKPKKRETKAEERAKIEGKRRKELELTLKEKELEFDRVQKELDEYKGRLNEFESTKIKPTEHPDFISFRDDILKEAKDEVEELEAPNAQNIYKNLGSFIDRYRKAGEDTTKFKDELAKELFTDIESWDELDKEDKRVVNAALKLIKKSTSKADKLEELRNSLEERANKGILAVGVKEYERAISEFKPILDPIGDLDDEIIETDPYSIESVTAKIARTDKKRVDAAKKDVMEILNGLRPLTQEELDKLNANGTDVKTFQAQRQKAFVDKKKKLAALLVQGLVTRSTFKEMAQELAELKGKKESEESEDDALRKVSKKKGVVKEEPKKAKTREDIWAKHDLLD